MARKVNPSGFRETTPGKCTECGYDDDWLFDGSGTIYCGCQTCSECGEFGGHTQRCSEQEESEQHSLGCICADCSDAEFPFADNN